MLCFNAEHNSTYRKKTLTDFFASQNTKDFLDALMEEGNVNMGKSPYLKSRGKNGGTWMSPVLFIKFAMWINPRFEIQVIRFVYDLMIQFRNEAGDAYREIGSAVQKIVSRKDMPFAMKNIAKAMNFIVFGDHRHEMRNQQGEEIKMRELFELERQVAMLINDGFITSYDTLIEYLRRKWKDKYLPRVLRS